MANPIKQAIDDVRDIAHYARNFWEIIKALLPISWTGGLRVLNMPEAGATLSEEEPPTPEALAASLRKLKNRLKSEVLTEDGRVDYAALSSTDAYKLLEETSQSLRLIDPAAIEGDDARIAFWINLYNVLSIHGVAALGITRSVMEIPTFFRRVAYQVGEHFYTPDDIENGVLRKNGRHPATKAKAFRANDPRLASCPSYVEPRIHAGLVCASTSCPPVAFYDAERLDFQLNMAAANYVADVQIDEQKRALVMPITFLYYGGDFGGVTGIQEFLMAHDPEREEAFRRAFAAGYRFTYPRYDWSLNANI